MQRKLRTFCFFFQLIFSFILNEQFCFWAFQKNSRKVVGKKFETIEFFLGCVLLCCCWSVEGSWLVEIGCSSVRSREPSVSDSASSASSRMFIAGDECFVFVAETRIIFFKKKNPFFLNKINAAGLCKVRRVQFFWVRKVEQILLTENEFEENKSITADFPFSFVLLVTGRIHPLHPSISSFHFKRNVFEIFEKNLKIGFPPSEGKSTKHFVHTRR